MQALIDEGPFAPCPAPFNLAAHILAAGDACPDKCALAVLSSDASENWTYADLSRAVRGTATGLLSAGLRKGDLVLMRLGNTVDFPVAYLGALTAGLVPVPTSPALTQPEVAVIADMLQPACVLKAPGIAVPAGVPAITLDALRSFRSLPPTAFDMGDPERLAYIVFTSGTSGTPQAVAHAHRAIWARQMMFEDWYGLRPGDRVLHAGAFNWTYTLGTGLLDPWTVGATALIPRPEIRTDDLFDIMAAHEATIFAAAPGVYRQLLTRSTPPAMPALRHGLSAGEKLPQTTADDWRRMTGCGIFEAFGMSECSTFISHAPTGIADAGTMGRAQRGRRIALLRDGAVVARGEEGTIAIDRRDPGLMLGYHGDAATTRARMQGDWFLTGDQAVMRPDGALEYMGRADDMMNAGGFRVSPIEVEAVLARLPGIRSVAVTTVRIKAETDVIAAFYTGPETLDDAVLRDYVKHELARYKQPRLFVHRADLPRSVNGKLLRRQLRKEFKGYP